MKRWAALLKGVNVGGNRKLPMAELKLFLEGLGFTDVKTLLASGNVVFSSKESDAVALEGGGDAVHARIERGVAEPLVAEDERGLLSALRGMRADQLGQGREIAGQQCVAQ